MYSTDYDRVTPIKTVEKDGAITRFFIDLSDINDSLLLDSGNIIAQYIAPDEKVMFTLEVMGDVKVYYDDETYKYPSNFPKELVEKIKNKDWEGVEVGNNNWFEILEYQKSDKGEWCWDGYSDVVEAELSSFDKIVSVFEDWTKNFEEEHNDMELE